MEVQFREVNPFDFWIWLEFETNPSPAEQQYVEELFASWFYLGKLGGFNAENLQVQDTGIDLNYLDYDSASLSSSMMAPMHNMADFQYQDHWGRCWFDLGTSDLIALDVLINALYQLSLDYVSIRRLIVGGVNEDWPIGDRQDDRFDQFEDFAQN
ncbi:MULTISPECIES: DUF3531 family protein [unclassified Synechocystis]|uniref:DUF3531 family protein n=1 Tax=unclassified Synechocystis TaxID=2640012 RepID=UPI00041F42E1|nr:MULTISPECIES: DUF3531 family protein [unclassified Synechocystis]AIE73410.1 hypothetical protein D082_08810 [Synechocystis sp. PCC 6714]MCT0254230.1 DUF3531 family protein [Synechocystis sp. CS-94]